LKEIYVIDGPMRGMSFTLDDGITTIGRAPDNDIRILEKGISRHHAQLIKKEDTIFILDLASLQGVFIDGQQIDPGVEFEVKEESKIEIGRTVLSFQKEFAEKRPVKPHPSERPVEVDEFLEDSSRNYIRSLELLLKVSNVLVQSLNLDELFDQVMEQIFNLLKRIDRGAILLLDKETGRLKEVASKIRGGDKKDFSSEISYSRTIVKRTINEGKPIKMSDTSFAQRTELSDSIQRMNVRSIMCVPLTYKEDIQGVIYVDTIGLPEGFRRDDLKVLTALSNTAAIAIENARLYNALRKELSERRKAERALQTARKELEKEVEKRTGELSKTVEFLKQEIADHMQAEEALQEREEKYRSLFQESHDALYISARDGKFVEVNKSYLDLFGYTKKEITNLKAQDTYVNLDDRSRFQEEIEKKGSVRDFEVKFRKKDGTEMDCLVTATVWKAENGRILGYHGIIRETIERDKM
jgi:PAS domain S-box-containing protein